MSTQFTTDPIETLGEWNAVLGANQCCCPMPACPVPTAECESVVGEASCPPAPDPPEEPGNDESILYGCYIPFDAESLDDEDDLPVYTKLKETFKENTVSGTYKSFFTDISVEGSETRRSELLTINYPDSYTIQGWEQTEVEGPPGNWAISGYGSGGVPSGIPSTVTTWTDVDDICEKTATTLIKKTGAEESEEGNLAEFRTTTNLVPTTDPATQPPIYEYAWDLQRVARDQKFELLESTTKAALIAEAEANIPAEFPEPATGSDCFASRAVAWPKKKDFTWPACAAAEPRDANIGCTLTKFRFRWVIPDTFTGSYFKITWDVVFFPDNGDPSAVSTDQTWEWSGPPIRKSGWYEIDPPESAGEVRVVNVRFECYRSPYGNKPQVTGEAVDIPPPEP